MATNNPVPLRPGEGPIRCPAVRSLIKEDKLDHEDLKTASVQELVEVFSGQASPLAPNQPGSLANVTGFFAIHNHGVPAKDDRGFFSRLFGKSRDILDAAAVAAGKPTTRRFDLRLLGTSGNHPGTVNFFSNDEVGEFQPRQFETVMSQVSDGTTLTIDGIARMIIMANDGAWDRKGTPLDLAKSAGEWALMVCALRAGSHTTDISVTDLERMYSQADSRQLLIGTMCATALDWIKVTAQIAAAIARQQTALGVARDVHAAYGDINEGHDEKLCPCMTCNPAAWRSLS